MNKWIEQARSDYVANIGQLSRDDVRALDKAVKAGMLVKYRGYWNNGSPVAGYGPLKTIWSAA